jgi:hypothetical protein
MGCLKGSILNVCGTIQQCWGFYRAGGAIRPHAHATITSGIPFSIHHCLGTCLRHMCPYAATLLPSSLTDPILPRFAMVTGLPYRINYQRYFFRRRMDPCCLCCALLPLVSGFRLVATLVETHASTKSNQYSFQESKTLTEPGSRVSRLVACRCYMSSDQRPVGRPFSSLNNFQRYQKLSTANAGHQAGPVPSNPQYLNPLFNLCC